MPVVTLTNEIKTACLGALALLLTGSLVCVMSSLSRTIGLLDALLVIEIDFYLLSKMFNALVIYLFIGLLKNGQTSLDKASLRRGCQLGRWSFSVVRTHSRRQQK